MITTALIGSPVAHSISPALFKLYADEHGLEYAHSKFDVKPEYLETVIKSLGAYGFAGVNITLPYKTEVMQYLDSISPEARAIGAVNTIKVNNGRLEGYNTDAFGALKAIEKASDRTILSTDSALIFGTGGAARAIAWVLLSRGISVSVVYRNPKSHRTETFMCDFENKIEFIDCDTLTPESLLNHIIICNATSAGMHPNNHESPINLEQFGQVDLNGVIVFDAIFNPSITKLQNWAKERGATLAYGIDMMIYQGIVAFEYWTGKEVSEDTIRKAEDVLLKRS